MTAQRKWLELGSLRQTYGLLVANFRPPKLIALTILTAKPVIFRGQRLTRETPTATAVRLVQAGLVDCFGASRLEMTGGWIVAKFPDKPIDKKFVVLYLSKHIDFI
jgi:hypothetical protein